MEDYHLQEGLKSTIYWWTTEGNHQRHSQVSSAVCSI